MGFAIPTIGTTTQRSPIAWRIRGKFFCSSKPGNSPPAGQRLRYCSPLTSRWKQNTISPNLNSSPGGNTVKSSRSSTSHTPSASLPSLFLLHKQGRVLLAEILNLWIVVQYYVHVLGMKVHVSLVIFLGRIKSFERNDLRDNGLPEYSGRVQLLDIRLADPLLVLRRKKNCRAILRAMVGPLLVQLCGIMCDGKEHLQDLPERNLRRIKNYFDSLRVPRPSRAHFFIRRRIRRSSRIAGSGAKDALQSLKHGLNSPEASTSDHSSLPPLCRGQWIVCRGIWKGHNITRRVATRSPSEGQQNRQRRYCPSDHLNHVLAPPSRKGFCLSSLG